MAIIDGLLKGLLETSGSDLHLEEGQRPKYRVVGSIQTIEAHDVLTRDMMSELLREICPSELWKRYEISGDIDFAYSLHEGYRFRTNYYKHHAGMGAVFRAVPFRITPLDELGVPEQVKSFAQLKSGLVLVTGPTGSGKSTTLAALLDHINSTQARKIVTIEDPVEFIHRNKKSMIVHREVGSDTPSFVAGLRSTMKSDVDIVLVGEMRDQESILLALNAAQTGILVFGTLHTNSAVKTFDRVIDIFPLHQKNYVKMALSNTLKGVLSQQLVKSADGKRRLAACELMMITPGISAMLFEGDISNVVSEIQASRSRGSILMDDCLVQMVMQGRVLKEEAFMKALDKIDFQKKVGPVKF